MTESTKERINEANKEIESLVDAEAQVKELEKKLRAIQKMDEEVLKLDLELHFKKHDEIEFEEQHQYLLRGIQTGIYYLVDFKSLDFVVLEKYEYIKLPKTE